MGRWWDPVLGSGPVASVCAASSRRRLRVLGYHGVPDPAPFDRQIAWLVEHFQPVSLDQVIAAARNETELPRRAVCVTFDDGHANVIEHALPVLERHGVPATLFVCPSWVDSDVPYWWDTVDAALARQGSVEFDGRSWRDGSLKTYLKRVPDAERRSMVAELAAADPGVPAHEPHLTSDQLRRWTGAGHTVGNHTWDHPCLDMCSSDEQRAQVQRAHDWLTDFAPDAPLVFAYPNGDWTATSESLLRELGYPVALLFDHRLVQPGVDWLQTSRLRIDASAPLDRFRAVVSGVHSGVFGLAKPPRSKAARMERSPLLPDPATPAARDSGDQRGES